jgi:hypothetical protein
MTSSPPPTEAILEVLRHRATGAAFVTEIQAEVGATHLETLLNGLAESEQILILTEPASDPHLERFISVWPH